MINIIKKAAAVVLSAALAFSFNFTSAPELTVSADSINAIWPVPTEYQNITTYFDPQRNVNNVSGYHNAIDIDSPNGTPIYAARPGVVISADWKDAYGNMAILYHEDIGVYTFYAHADSLTASAGSTVQAGDIIGYVGNTGNSYGSHLHFGICDNLLSGWPTITYYDPLTYFSYTDAPIQSVVEECDCTTDYAGIYVTKNVTTYLNIRSGHGSNYSVVGEIQPGDEVKVTKSNGEWAHVEYKGICGYSSLEFLEKKADLESNMTISDETKPSGVLDYGQKFSIKGKISSEFPIAKVWGGIYKNDETPTEQVFETTPNSSVYDLSGYVNNKLIFGKLEAGEYKYIIKATDSTGAEYTLINSDFSVKEQIENAEKGDVTLDGDISIADYVKLQNYLLGRDELNDKQIQAADINEDKTVNVFDLIMIKRMVVETEKK